MSLHGLHQASRGPNPPARPALFLLDAIAVPEGASIHGNSQTEANRRNAYRRNGEELPADYGAPLRMKVPRQFGYKNVKFLSHIPVTDTLKNIRNGQGSVSPDYGYSWYAGI